MLTLWPIALTKEAQETSSCGQYWSTACIGEVSITWLVGHLVLVQPITQVCWEKWMGIKAMFDGNH